MLTRLKLQVATHRRRLIALCILVGVGLCIGGVYIYLTPPVVDQPPEETEAFELELLLEDSAVVENETPLYETGEELRTKPAYFLNVSPNLTLEVRTTGTGYDEIDIDHRLVLEERATRDGDEFWRQERVVATNETTAADGGTDLESSIDVVGLRNDQVTTAAVTEAAGTPTAQLRLESSYELETDDGRTHEGEMVVDPTLEFVENAYWIEGDRTAEETATRTIEREPVVESPNVRLAVVLSMLGVLSLCLGGFVATKSRKLDPHTLRIEATHEEYSEWISKGDLVATADSQYVYVDSLEDLVNVGIDADKRVIYDSDLDVYTVVDGDVVYYFTRNPTDLEIWSHV